MFGYGIKFYRKKEGVKVDPVKDKPKEDVDYKKWKREQETALRNEILEHNKKVMYAAIKEKVEEYKERFTKEFPRPFEVGEMVTYRYYDSSSNPFSLGWHGSPSTLAKTFEAPMLAGPITFPVNNVILDASFLYDKLENICGYHYEEKISEVRARNVVYDAFEGLLKHRKFLAEWIIDFDWESLKIPCGNCANEDGWLNLRWGGFNAGYFRNADTPMAKMQVELWNKERGFKEAEKKYKTEIEQMRAEFEKEKAKLF